MRKSQGLTLNTIVIAVLVIIVLVTLALIFGGRMLQFGEKTEAIEESATVDINVAECKLECIKFNSECIIYDRETKQYKVLNNDYCENLYSKLSKCVDEGYLQEAGSDPNSAQTSENKNDLKCKP